MRNKISLLAVLFLVLSLFLAACGDEEEATDVPKQAEAEQPADAPTAEPEPTKAPATGEKATIRWYVGLGAGSDEPTFVPQEKVVEEFNATHDNIELVLEIVDNTVAYDTLATQIAAGNAPDIVGPVGIRGRDSFKGAWLDLQPLVDKNNYDLSDFDASMVEFYKVGDELLGLPFAVFPSFLLVNLDLFDEAGLDYPPQEYGAPYADGDPWTIEKMEELALMMTVDGNGNDANSPDFDPEIIVQFGYGELWSDARGVGSLFGSGSLVDADGNAQVPAAWAEAWKWVYDGMWEKYFYPNGPYGNSDVLGAGNWFQSGHTAMVHTHLWYVGCCMFELANNWDMAAVPSYQGDITAKMHADTFEIHKDTKHPDAAFEVLTYLLGPVAAEMNTIYGGMPARLSLQDTFFDKFGGEKFPGVDVNWQVVVDSMAYADNPNHESWMPSFQESNDKYNEYWNKWVETPGLDLDAELDALTVDLQRIFDAAGE